MYQIDESVPVRRSETELRRFAELVMQGGQVAGGLLERLRRAASLVTLHANGEMIGTAAIKIPNGSYRKRVFRDAQADQSSADYPFELGWIYIVQEHRGHKQTGPLIEAALNSVSGESVFATTLNSNLVMQHALEKAGFVRTGSAYPSTEHKGERVILYLMKGVRS